MNLLSEPALRMLKLLTPEWCVIPRDTFEKGRHIWDQLWAYDLADFVPTASGCCVKLTKNASRYNPSVFN